MKLLQTSLVRRLGTRSATSAAALQNDKSRETLVVLGAGWAGYNFLNKVDRSKYNIISISSSASFVTTPLLPSAVAGALTFRDITEPLRSAADASFYHAWAEKINFEDQTVISQLASAPPTRGKDPLVKEQQRDARPSSETWDDDRYSLKYDKLVIATGCYNQTFNTPGVREYAYFLRDTESASAIRYQIYELMDAAGWPKLSDKQRRSMLTWTIVGGGPTGAELAAELHDLAISKEFVRLYPSLAPMIKIKLIDAAPAILSTFDESLAKYAAKKFKRDGIDILTSRKILRVERDKIVTEQDGEIGTALVVWSTGNKASPLNEAITGLKKDKKESIITNDRMQVIKEDGTVLENVYALGDCAQIEGNPLPATAQVANQQGIHLAQLLSDKITDPAKQPFQYRHFGTMSSIGGNKGLIQLPFGFSVAGRFAYFAWRSYYWLSSLSLRTKFNLMVRWTATLLLGRDTSRM